MKVKKTIRTSLSLRFLIIIPVIILVLIGLDSCSATKRAARTNTQVSPTPTPPSPQKDQSKENDEVPFVVVEEMPMFPGGDSTLLAYISRNIRYPEYSKTNKIEGRVIIRFCVTAKGTVDKVSILRGVSPELDTEAVRVVSSLPAFMPGKQGGKPVPVWYMVPVTFKLK